MQYNTITSSILVSIFAASLSACGGSSSSSETQDPSNPSSNTGNDNNATLIDTTWSAGNDRMLGLAFTGSNDAPTITMLKGTPKAGQDGDIFSVRTSTSANNELSEIKNIDNLNDRTDLQDLEVITANGSDYAIACQDGANTSGYEKSASLHIFKLSDPAKLKKIDVELINDFEMRACNSISASFGQGTSTAMEAKVFMVGQSWIELPSGGGENRESLAKVLLTIDTEKAVDEVNAIDVDAISLEHKEYYSDAISSVTSWNSHVYFTVFDDSEGTNILKYMNTALTSPTVEVVDETVYDPFVSGTAQSMIVKDMFMIPATSATDYDTIYLVSSSSESGIVVARYRRDLKLSDAMSLSTDSGTINCSDVITGVANQGVGQKLWCHDATDAGKIIETLSPVSS
ncbi:hypothetical protein HF888_14410 [Bermanella marisrubri]|uniref:Uncharacterized protein n=1 Tax=Bermanella marisrubri TaxID=207949 RepID=Q1N2B4_9GAMM|nr:hypothetical protein [Bermanella marisrubri]EAT12250.1 hypothetical protein RED65_15463 [Bermanella marisrubri]QIZ85343.1 hypothetical protein HF888_14410 [Bermanella marisrubri]